MAVDIACISLSNVIESVTGQDILCYWIPDSAGVGVGCLYWTISSKLLQECFDSSLSLHCYGGSIPTGLSGFVRLSANNIFQFAYQNNIVSFTFKRGSINVLRVTPVVGVSSIHVHL